MYQHSRKLSTYKQLQANGKSCFQIAGKTYIINDFLVLRIGGHWRFDSIIISPANFLRKKVGIVASLGNVYSICYR